MRANADARSRPRYLRRMEVLGKLAVGFVVVGAAAWGGVQLLAGCDRKEAEEHAAQLARDGALPAWCATKPYGGINGVCWTNHADCEKRKIDCEQTRNYACFDRTLITSQNRATVCAKTYGLCVEIRASRLTDPESTDVGECLVYRTWRDTEKAEDPAKVWLTITSDQLQKAYAANEADADGLYRGKILRVTGAVRSIKIDAGEDFLVALWTKSEAVGALAYFTGDGGGLARVSVGDRIAIRCLGAGAISGGPILRDCVLDGAR